MASRLWRLAALVLFAASSLPSFSETVAMPRTEGHTLAEQKVRLPEELKGRQVVLIFGFSRAAREQVAGWGRRMSSAYDKDAAVAFYQVVMLAEAPKLARSFIIRSIRSDVSENFKQHTLLLDSPESAWKDILKPVDKSVAYVVICDGAGNIRWTTQGASEAHFEELRQQMTP